MSSEKILSFLVNDILDYAQISAGKFRKFFHKFDLKECLDEIVMIMDYKSSQLGIKIVCDYRGFKLRKDRSIIRKEAQKRSIFINLD